MKEFEKLEVLMLLPHTTITIFDGKKITQKTVVAYSEVTKQININRKALLQQGFHYFDGKLIKIN
nr:hypothetical protein [uncultured Flavobacterium sp.]